MLSNLGYETNPSARDLLTAARTMWTDISSNTGEALARSAERMLLVTAHTVLTA
jgi:hypothetical protein